MTIILVGATPTVLISASADRAALRTALATAQPALGQADWAAAVALAAGAAQGFSDAHIAVVSDGGLPPNLPPLPPESIYVPIGSSSDNVAISALATRDTPGGPQLFASVTNYGGQNQSLIFGLRLNGQLVDSRRLVINAGITSNLSWDLPADTVTIEAALSDFALDYLPLDNTAFAVNSGGSNNRLLLQTAGNLFLEQVYSVMPGIDPYKAGPEIDLNGEESRGFDLYLLDSVPLPDPLPAADTLIINPQTGSGNALKLAGIFSDTTIIRVADTPLLQFVQWSNIHILRAQGVSGPGLQPLVQAAGGPLLLAGEQNGHRLAVLTFDLRDSDLPLQVPFPILMANLTHWLNPGRAFALDRPLLPGDALRLTPAASASQVHITKPDGSSERVEVGQGQLLFSNTQQPGFYQVAVQDNGGVRDAGIFAVNLFAPQESAIRPATSLIIGSQSIDSGEEGDVGQRELWPWLLLPAFLILMVEWWVHHRGATLPQINIR